MTLSARRHFRGDNRLASLSTYDRRLITEDNPVVYLPLWGNSSGLLDQSGNNHHGLAVGSYSTTSFLNGDSATVFNGNSQYVEVASHAALSVPTTGVLTIEAWMRPDTLSFSHYLSTGYIHWMGKANNISGVTGQNEYVARMYNLATTDSPARPNRISGYCFNLSGGLGAGSYFQDGIAAGEWIHYVLVINTLNTSSGYPTGYTKVYKNGVLRDQDALRGYNIVPTAGSNPFRIATAEAASFFQGSICKVAIYNYELSAQRIYNHYRSVVAPPASGTSSFIKNVGTASSTSAGTTLTITVPAGGVSAGSTLLAKVVHAYTGGGPTMTDSRGNTYTRDQTSPDSGNTIRASLFSAQINTALEPGDTIQLTAASSVTNKALSIDEFSNLTFVSPLDVKNNNAGASATPGTTISINTSNADDLVYGLVATNGPVSEMYTEDFNGFTGLTTAGTTGAGNVAAHSAFKSVSVAGSYQYKPLLGSSENWVEILAAYKAGIPVVTPAVSGSASFIQNIGALTAKTSGTSLVFTVPVGGVPAGHTLIIRSLGDITATGAAITDSRGNTYTRDRTAPNSTNSMRGSISSGLIVTALQAGDTITLTWPVSITTRVATIDEFANIAAPIVIDAQNGGTGTGTAVTKALTTTNANDLIVAFVGVEGPIEESYTDDTIHQWSGLTRVGTTGSGSGTNKTINGAYRAVAATSTYTYAPTLGTSENWLELIVAYKAG